MAHEPLAEFLHLSPGPVSGLLVLASVSQLVAPATGKPSVPEVQAREPSHTLGTNKPRLHPTQTRLCPRELNVLEAKAIPEPNGSLLRADLALSVERMHAYSVVGFTSLLSSVSSWSPSPHAE